MMSDRRCWKRHEIARVYLDLFFVDLCNAAAGQNIKPLFLVLVRLVHKRFLPGGYARDAHAFASNRARGPVARRSVEMSDSRDGRTAARVR
jgi:hypothetical protein